MEAINYLFGNVLYYLFPIIIVGLLFIVSIYWKLEKRLAFFICVIALFIFIFAFAFYVGFYNIISLKINDYEFNLPTIVAFLIVLWVLSVVYSKIMNMISGYTVGVIEELQEHQEYRAVLDEQEEENFKKIEEINRRREERRKNMSPVARALSKK